MRLRLKEIHTRHSDTYDDIQRRMSASQAQAKDIDASVTLGVLEGSDQRFLGMGLTRDAVIPPRHFYQIMRSR
jgi:hypothetical protein